MTQIHFTDPNLTDGAHRMTLRMNGKYHAYLQHMAFKTNLDMSQIIRLRIHTAPHDPHFNALMESYIRADRRGILYVHDWQHEDHMLWKKL